MSTRFLPHNFKSECIMSDMLNQNRSNIANILYPVPVPNRLSVRRNLFNTIPSKKENDDFVANELKKIADADSKRWGFNFEQECPFDGKIKWEASNLENVPSLYWPKNLTSDMNKLSTRSTPKTPSPIRKPFGISQPAIQPVKFSNNLEKRLESTLESVSTASTTVTSASTALSTQKNICTASKTATVAAGTNKVIRKRTLTQTHITDFMRSRKRTFSSVEDEKSGKRTISCIEEENQNETEQTFSCEEDENQNKTKRVCSGKGINNKRFRPIKKPAPLNISGPIFAGSILNKSGFTFNRSQIVCPIFDVPTFKLNSWLPISFQNLTNGSASSSSNPSSVESVNPITSFSTSSNSLVGVSDSECCLEQASKKRRV